MAGLNVAATAESPLATSQPFVQAPRGIGMGRAAPEVQRAKQERAGAASSVRIRRAPHERLVGADLWPYSIHSRSCHDGDPVIPPRTVQM